MKKRLSPRYIAFLAIMALIIAIGLFMIIYGSLHNGIPVPPAPGSSPLAGTPLHG